eukprot:TRINITY_DN11420_c0_g1_i7.p1 TRINITY_DN11420_c0_g1~~TRINITY_DN11420_c0_g1_i7.p1  ORF type:complete len:390 (-),score=79.73 TRINITY_DN11420_c0_g1_i7:206-1375(-)
MCIRDSLRGTYHNVLREKWGEFICKYEFDLGGSLYLMPPDKIGRVGDEHEVTASKLRRLAAIKDINSALVLNVEDLELIPAPETQPYMFKEIYTKIPLGVGRPNTVAYGNQNRGAHVIVFVHGFQGSQYDLKLLKNNLNILYPEFFFLCSSANEQHTSGDIEQMGERLAQEVSLFIQEWCPGRGLDRLSFIGHSLGGLIVRSALKKLGDYAPKMYSYISLSSPHLGCQYDSSRMIDAGMWVLQKWKNCLCLQQLTLTDAKQFEDCYLYKLSKTRGLSWFKNVCLLSSYQDSYAPFESARITFNPKAVKNSADEVYYKQMAMNILAETTPETLCRVDVNFKIKEKTLDSLIGRKAHILFLEDQAYMRMFMYHFRHLFEINDGYQNSHQHQ